MQDNTLVCFLEDPNTATIKYKTTPRVFFGCSQQPPIFLISESAKKNRGRKKSAKNRYFCDIKTIRGAWLQAGVHQAKKRTPCRNFIQTCKPNNNGGTYVFAFCLCIGAFISLFLFSIVRLLSCILVLLFFAALKSKTLLFFGLMFFQF